MRTFYTGFIIFQPFLRLTTVRLITPYALKYTKKSRPKSFIEGLLWYYFIYFQSPQDFGLSTFCKLLSVWFLPING